MARWQKVVWMAAALVLLVAVPAGISSNPRLPHDFAAISFWGVPRPAGGMAVRQRRDWLADVGKWHPKVDGYLSWSCR
ncbi:MAG: hypothetical protein AMJ46_14525 [Latescibacteria bacterium DG_63]|nr:MAG: hypothetical protein AMJ46_14525 [Latescibacteria bacterium DG_63]